MSATPWSDLLGAAARLGVTPDTFWRMSVREWRLIAAGVSGPIAMARAQLEELTMRFPDKGADDGGKQ